MDSVAETAPADLVEIGRYSSTQAVFDHGLVALSLGHPFWFEACEDGFRMLVEPLAAAAIREQLTLFDRESREWPPRSMVDVPAARGFESFTPLLWSLAVLIVFWCQARWPALTDTGMVDAPAIVDRGQVWRLLIALFLHADIGHLVANLLSGFFAFAAVLSTTGLRRGWILLAAAGVLGNALAAGLAYPHPYHSLGASTAIFGGIGLLTGRALRVVVRLERQRRWQTWIVPIAAGVTVLGLFGAGGQQVDVVAHLTGFCSGAGLGLVFLGATAASKKNLAAPHTRGRDQI